MSWKNCLEQGEAIKISPGRPRSRSLRNSSRKMLDFVTGIKISKDNAPILLKDAYEALLELTHSILYLKGYKVLNHICIGHFIKEELKDDETFSVFDKYRKIRNSIVYYGEDVEKEIAEQGIKDIKEIFDKIEIQIKNLETAGDEKEAHE